MQKLIFDTPAVYGDHHVLEVRRILLAIPGVEEVDASSAFHRVEVIIDPNRTAVENIHGCLQAAGYLDLLPTASEVSLDSAKRRTAGFEPTRQSVSFSQKVAVQARSGWPCPGMGKLKVEE
jgi:copper chaperone CopZ